jgi:O-antigen/teichoic acid export membrane protein
MVFDKTVLKSMMGFSGWNILANISNMLGHQGTLVLINMFFTPVVVAAQAIAGQVSGAMMQFVNNFRTAINPQVIKLYAAGEKDASKKLTLETTIYCFDLILMLGLPAIIVMNKLMSVWLVEVPQYAVLFTQWIIVRQIIGTFSASFYIPMMAANKMKTNSMAAVYLGMGEFVLLYIAFKLGCGPMWIQYLGIFVTIGFSLIVKPWVLIREIDYSLKEICRCYWSCTKVLALSLLVSLIPAYYLDDSLLFSVLKALIAGMAVVIASYIFMEKQSKEKLMLFLKNKISNVRK